VEQAVEAKIEEQAAFVEWWGEAVTPNKETARRAKNADRRYSLLRPKSLPASPSNKSPKVRGKGKRSNVADLGYFVEQAESLTGITQQHDLGVLPPQVLSV
jgi:hypothetical protein